MASEIIERRMYNGAYEMVHNPNAKGRAPRYVVTDTHTDEIMKPQGVTTILGKTLAKDLIDWAVGMAQNFLKTKLPSVTLSDIEEAGNQYKYRRDAGADTGSEAHALVENLLKGLPVDLFNASKEAALAYGAFHEWYEGSKPEIINVEEVVYSQDYGYAGTYDCMLKIDGKVYLCDLKTTNASKKAPNGVYAEYFLQLGAYAGAHEEQRQYELANGGTNLVPIGGLLVISAKKDGKLDLVSNEDVGISVEECSDLFKQVVNLNRFLGETTKKLGGK